MITKRPKPSPPIDSKSVDSFISSAPDAKKEIEVPKVSTIKGKRLQITHTLPPEMLARLDEVASAKGMTRAGFINHAISEALGR